MERKFVVRALGLAVVSCALGAASARADVFNLGGTQNADGTWNGLASLTTVPVGNAGNATDPTTGHVHGSVNYAYNISKYDVTAGQYTAFLNAVAKTDTYGLYNSNMLPSGACGISQTGSPGSFSYATTKNPNFPVNDVTWGDAARFCNWLQNGQPALPEGNGTTETGSYTLNGITDATSLMAVTRNPGAVWCIPTEDEWYKAAFYDPTLNGGSGGYWLYPTRSNTAPHNTLSNAATDPNDANYYIFPNYTDPTNFLTAVGTFASSPSAYGTFDQGGDVNQWNERNLSGLYRGLRGGTDIWDYSYLRSDSSITSTPTIERSEVGFRVSQVPEPASLGILTIGILGMLVRRRGVRR